MLGHFDQGDLRLRFTFEEVEMFAKLDQGRQPGFQLDVRGSVLVDSQSLDEMTQAEYVLISFRFTLQTPSGSTSRNSVKSADARSAMRANTSSAAMAAVSLRALMAARIVGFFIFTMNPLRVAVSSGSSELP